MVRNQILTNTISQILTRGISAAATFITAMVIARTYGAIGFGELTKVFLAVGIMYLFIDAGLNAVFVQAADSEGSRRDSQFTTLLTVRFIWSLCLMGVVIVIFTLLPHSFLQLSFAGRLGVLAASFTLPAQGILISCNALFQHRLVYIRATIAQAVGSVVNLALLALVLVIIPPSAPLSLVWIIAVISAGSIAAAIASLWLTRVRLTLSIDRSFFVSLAQKGWIFGATLVVIAINDYIGRFLLTRCCTTAEVGIYGLAYKFFEFPLALPNFFINSMFPVLVSRRKHNEKITRHVIWSAALLLGTSLAVAAILYSMAPLFVLIKQDFAASIVPFRVLVFTLPLFFISALTMWLLVLFEQKKTLFMIYLFATLCNIMLGVMLVPTYRVIGPALLVFFSESVVVLLSLISLIVYTRRKK